MILPTIAKADIKASASNSVNSETFYQLVHDLETALKRAATHTVSDPGPSDSYKVTVCPQGGLNITDFANGQKAYLKFTHILKNNTKISTFTNDAFAGIPRTFAVVIQMPGPFKATRLLPTPHEIDVPSGRTGFMFANQTDAQTTLNLLNAIQQCSVANIDWSFINKPGMEGLSPATGNVPNDDSGVTFAHGVDIGTHSDVEIKSWPMSDELKAKILPYTNRKGQAARDYLRIHPGTLMYPVDAIELDKAAHQVYEKKLISLYDRDTSGASFVELPREAQTVIMSTYYNLGTQIASYSYWKTYLTQQDWSGAVHELNNWFHDPKKAVGNPRDVARHKEEARFLSGLGKTDIVP
ncbi:hypothetical protein CCAX7_46380 [Capsulimonas corticalis]|uniref:Uncharacterized protein n=2 Tax=Capsulimonas corticalis TaxID=2219043 RepID=A0A402D591_9BACT|nr:hypothetical protein CCAX7_46380 [Capsulimonas corticalis]